MNARHKLTHRLNLIFSRFAPNCTHHRDRWGTSVLPKDLSATRPEHKSSPTGMACSSRRGRCKYSEAASRTEGVHMHEVNSCEGFYIAKFDPLNPKPYTLNPGSAAAPRLYQASTGAPLQSHGSLSETSSPATLKLRASVSAKCPSPPPGSPQAVLGLIPPGPVNCRPNPSHRAKASHDPPLPPPPPRPRF